MLPRTPANWRTAPGDRVWGRRPIPRHSIAGRRSCGPGWRSRPRTHWGEQTVGCAQGPFREGEHFVAVQVAQLILAGIGPKGQERVFVHAAVVPVIAAEAVGTYDARPKVGHTFFQALGQVHKRHRVQAVVGTSQKNLGGNSQRSSCTACIGFEYGHRARDGLAGNSCGIMPRRAWGPGHPARRG